MKMLNRGSRIGGRQEKVASGTSLKRRRGPVSSAPTLVQRQQRPGLVPLCDVKVGGKLGRVWTHCMRVGLKVEEAALWW